eukprot:32497_1
MATHRRALHRQNTLRKTNSRLSLLIDDIIQTIEDTTSPENLESYKHVCTDIQVRRITLILSIYHDWNNYIPDEIHTELSSCRNNTSLKNEFVSHLIESYTKYTKYHEAIFSWQEFTYKKQKVLYLIHNKRYRQEPHDTPCGIYDFVTNHVENYGFIQLLNDYHFILREYYEQCDSKFETLYNYITERIGPCDIATCVYMNALYSLKTDHKRHEELAVFSCKEIALMNALNEIHCLIFHSLDIHRWRQTELDQITDTADAGARAIHIDNELEISHESLNKLRTIICNKSDKLKHVFKSDYLRQYPKYIATQDFHGIQRPQIEEGEEDEDDEDEEFKGLDPDLEDTESTLDSLPNIPQLRMNNANRWSSMRSPQKMYKWTRSISKRSVSLFDGFSRGLTPRVHRQNSCNQNTSLFKRPFGSKSSNNKNDMALIVNNKYIKLQYLFGRKFCYWVYGKKKNDPFYVQPKHRTLKDEMIRRRLSVSEWNEMNERGRQLMKCAECKRLSGNTPMLEKYKIHCEITLEHIMSILLYCNVHQVRYHFKLTFHPLHYEDGDNAFDTKVFIKKWVKRHRKWSNFARLLRESVECFGAPFGMKMNSQKKVYYGIDTEIIFTKFKIGLIGPVSTTSNLYFMLSCMDHHMSNSTNGLILRLSNASYPYCMNVNWLSGYSSESEYLFFGGNEFVNIHSIVHLSSNLNGTQVESDYFYYINSFKLLLDIVNGKWSEQYYNDATRRALQTIIEHGLGAKTQRNYDITRREFDRYNVGDSGDEEDEFESEEEEEEERAELPQYIRHCFERYFVEEIQSIRIDLSTIDSCFGDIIRRYFVSHIHDGDEIKFNNLVSLLPKTNSIAIIGRSEMKWNQHILYKEFLEFVQIDCYLNDDLREIRFEFPTYHYLVYYDHNGRDSPLRDEVNKAKFVNELGKAGWKMTQLTQSSLYIYGMRFYRDNAAADQQQNHLKKRKQFKKKNRRSQSVQLRASNTQQLPQNNFNFNNKTSAVSQFLKQDDIKNTDELKPPIFNPSQSY